MSEILVRFKNEDARLTPELRDWITGNVTARAIDDGLSAPSSIEVEVSQWNGEKPASIDVHYVTEGK